jgi:hypothetical protein
MTLWRKLWILWSVLGLGSLLAILVARELGATITPATWVAWAIPGLGSFAVLEVWGLFRRGKGDTFSEMIWDMRTARSLVVFACAWGAFALTTGNVWPSFGAFALAWCGWHFWREGPYASR